MVITIPRWWPLPVLAIAAFAGVLAGWQLKPTPAPLFHNIIVKDTSLEALIPHVKPTLGERITKKTVKATQVAVSEGTPDTALIGAFCAARIAAATAALQTSAKADSGAVQRLPASAPVPILPPFWGKYRDGHLELGASRSDGSLYQAQFRAKPPLEWVAGRGGASDTAPIVRANRELFRLLPKIGECAKGGALGGLAGAGLGLVTGLDVKKATAIGAGAGCLGAGAS